MSEGFLSFARKPNSNRKWLSAVEVEEFRKDRLEHTRSGKGMRAELARQRTEIRRLRAELDAVMRILDAKNEPLNIKPQLAQELYDTCLLQLRQKSWSASEIASWTRVFMRLTEIDFEVMARPTEDDKPWVPFMQLCTRMILCLTDSPEYRSSLDLQSLHREIAEARRRLRLSAVCYAEARSYDLDARLRREAAPVRSGHDVIEGLLRSSG